MNPALPRSNFRENWANSVSQLISGREDRIKVIILEGGRAG